jgi:endo-1,4-beta-xylanase
MKRSLSLSLSFLVSVFTLPPRPVDAATGTTPLPVLSEAWADSFRVGVALNRATVDGRRALAAEIAGRHFSSVTAENDMKWALLQPEPGQYDFRHADALVDFGERHGMTVIGHTLVWHSQTPKWVFEENGEPVSREVLIRRMRDHIYTVAGRYRGRVKGWDVVNEAVSDGPEGLRPNSPWLRIIGEDFIDLAFRFAHEADPNAELYYNDYNLVNRDKRARTIAMLKGLIERGVPIHGVGMQGHYHLDWPAADEVDAAIKEYAALGLRVMITELDIDVLPRLGQDGVADIARREEFKVTGNPYVDGLPEDIQGRLAARYLELFQVFDRNREHIDRVTLWGLDDQMTWLNNFPVRGRTNHPLLFDRDLKPKRAFHALVERKVENQP